MNLQTILKDSEKEFQSEYEIAYKGIMSEEILRKGNSWFINFLHSHTQKVLEAVLEEIDGLNVEEQGTKVGDGYNTALRDSREKIKSEIK